MTLQGGARAALSRRGAHLVLASVVVAWAGAFAAIKHLLDAGVAAPEIALGRCALAAPGFIMPSATRAACRGSPAATWSGSSSPACS